MSISTAERNTGHKWVCLWSEAVRLFEGTTAEKKTVALNIFCFLPSRLNHSFVTILCFFSLRFEAQRLNYSLKNEKTGLNQVS